MDVDKETKLKEAIDRKKKQENAQRIAMIYHLSAYSKLHFDKVLLPYRVLYNLLILSSVFLLKNKAFSQMDISV